MKIRLAKKIVKAKLEVYPFYWHRRWTPYHLYVCTVNKPWGAKKDHRITKAELLTSKAYRRYMTKLDDALAKSDEQPKNVFDVNKQKLNKDYDS